MTTCELITKPIVRMVEEEGKDLDEIAGSVCPKVEYGREKIIRVIKDFLGEDYLIKHADILKYDIKMAEMAKKRKSHEKIDAKADSVHEKSSCKVSKSPKKEPIAYSSSKPENSLEITIRKLVEDYGFENVRNCIETLGCDET